MSYIVCLSPIAQIFQPALQQELISNPALIFERRPVKIFVERVGISFTLGSPKSFTRRQGSDRSQEVELLIKWLTGGEDGMQSMDTEVYGGALLEVDLDVMAEITTRFNLDAMNVKTKKQDSVEDAFTAKLKASMLKAEEMSHARVMRAVHRVWDHYTKQIGYNKEQGTATFAPSPSEILCQFVLRKEIEAEKQRQANIMAMMSNTISDSADMPQLMQQ